MLRMAAAKAIAPHPDPGEAWCVCCSLNNGRTLILPVDGIKAHTDLHNDYVRIDATWPPFHERRS